MIQDKIKNLIQKALSGIGIKAPEILVEHPAELAHGDFSTNVALVYAKEVGKKPRDLAEEIKRELEGQKDESIEKIEVAGPGFINFYLSQKFFAASVGEVLKKGDEYGKNELLAGKKIMIEYTDPNPFKEFHIGHLMSNAIGESIARLLEYTGADVKRANYQGDVGLHVAKAIWGKMQKPNASWGEAYTYGAQNYEKNKKEIDEINKKIYEKNDKKIYALYEEGRRLSLKLFEILYILLGTKFDYPFFESETGEIGKQIVLAHENSFPQSDNARVFKGEEYGLHTRVFVTKDGYPTYEAKELGLLQMKEKQLPNTDISVVVTGNEIKEYFKVVMQAALELKEVKNLAEKTKHITHGMLRLPSGKMSSRTGEVITAEALLGEAKRLIIPKVEENKEIPEDEKNMLADAIAVGAVKYSILRQATGHDIIFDFDTSLSFEGNSGPYLQYTYARAQSVLRKAEQTRNRCGTDAEQTRNKNGATLNAETTEMEKLLYRFSEVVRRAQEEYEPHYVATYLFELAQAFNNFYAKERIVDSAKEAPYRVALTRAVAQMLKNGLYLLGIKAPERM